MADEKNKGPKRKYINGALTLTVWENEGKEDTVYETFVLERSYKDKNDEWKTTSTLRLGDLPRASVLLREAYKNSTLKERDLNN